MELYIIRHGETDWNKTRRMQGRKDVPLNEFGRHLAQETAKALADMEFDLVYTSPLQRAEETAQIIAGEDAHFIKDERLIEMSFGSYEGLSAGKDTWNIPDKEFQNFFDAPEKYCPPKNGESFWEAKRRVEAFLTELREKEGASDKKILVSTHGAVLCVLLNLVLKKKEISNVWDGGVHKNCAVTIVEDDGHTCSIVQENHTYYKDVVKPW